MTERDEPMLRAWDRALLLVTLGCVLLAVGLPVIAGAAK